MTYMFREVQAHRNTVISEKACRDHKDFPLWCFPGPEECMGYDPNPAGLVLFYNYFLDLLSGTVRNWSITMTFKDMRLAECIAKHIVFFIIGHCDSSHLLLFMYVWTLIFRNTEVMSPTGVFLYIYITCGYAMWYILDTVLTQWLIVRSHFLLLDWEIETTLTSVR